jgi:hypothetical protein
MKKLLLILLCLPFIAFAQCTSGYCFNGYGVFTSEEGTYKGNWKDGKVHGGGAFKGSQYTYDGKYVNGTQHGQGKKTYTNGTIEDGLFEDGIFIGDTQSNDCNNLTNFGDITICLPDLIDMTECYSDPLVKLTADMFKGTDEEEIIGIYLLDDVYESMYDNFFEDGMGDSFIKIYSTTTVKGMDADEEILDYVASFIKPTFEDYDKSKIKSNIDDKFIDFDISMGKPILLEEYQISPKIRSFIILLKYMFEGEDVIQVASMNIMLIKDRVIFFAFYDKYKGFSEIARTKGISDYFALRLLNENLITKD